MCHRVTLTTIWTNTHLGEDVSLMISCCVRVCSILRMYEHTHESGILCIASVEASLWIWKKQLLYFNLCFIVWCQLFNCQKTVNWERRGWRQRERQWRDAKDEMKRQKEGEREDCYFPRRKPVTIHCCSSNCSSEGQSGNFNTRFSNLRAMSEGDLQFSAEYLNFAPFYQQDVDFCEEHLYTREQCWSGAYKRKTWHWLVLSTVNGKVKKKKYLTVSVVIIHIAVL